MIEVNLAGLYVVGLCVLYPVLPFAFLYSLLVLPWALLFVGLSHITARLLTGILKTPFSRLRPFEALGPDGWRDVWFGAALTGLLFVIGKTLIAMYLQNSDTASAWGDAAAALIGVLVWMYYSSIIVLFGAELTQAWAKGHGRAIEPAEGAVPAEAAKLAGPGPGDAATRAAWTALARALLNLDEAVTRN